MSLLKNGSIKTHHALWISFLILATTLAGVPFNSEFLPNYAQATGVTQTNQTGQNKFSNSEQFDNANWTKSLLTISADSTIAPDGTRTADTVTDSVDATIVQHFMSQTPVLVRGQTYTFSAYVKAGTLSYASLYAVGATGTTAGQANFNLTSGTSSSAFSGTFSYGTQRVGNGWWRCYLTYIDDGTGQQIRFETAGGTPSVFVYQGNGTGTLFFWGAQLVVGNKPGTYNRTVAASFKPSFVPKGVTQTNQLGQNLYISSEQLNNAAWQNFNTTINANTASTTDPFGGNGAEEIRETAVTGVFVVAATGAQTALGNMAGQTLTTSVYVKDNTRRYFTLRINTSIGHAATFDLTLGTVTYTDTGVTGKIVPIGRGWYRVSTTVTLLSTETATASVYHALNQTGGNYASYAGDVSKSLYIWGAQLVRGSKPGTYNPTTATAFKSTFVPTGATKSNQLGQNLLLVSEQLNSNAAWFVDPGASWSVNSVRAPDGTMTADELTWGTSSASFAFNVQKPLLDASTAYTFSVWAKVPTSTKNLILAISDVNLVTKTSSSKTVTTSWQRFSFSVTAGQLSNTGFLGVGFNGLASGNLIDLWGAQLVRGSKPGTYNRTVSATLNPNYQP